MYALHVTIAVTVALLACAAAYPVYETGAYRGSDWEVKHGDEVGQEFRYIGKSWWQRPATPWGYSATEKKEKPKPETAPKARRIVEPEPVHIVEEEKPSFVLTAEDIDEFDLEDLFLEEMGIGSIEQPAAEPTPSAPGSEESKALQSLELPSLPAEGPAEASMPEEEPSMSWGAPYSWGPTEEPVSMPEAEPYAPPSYPPSSPPAPAPEPEEAPAVVEIPPVKRHKPHKKEEPCKKGTCPCQCAKAKSCYCYPTLPKRHYPTYYHPQYSPYEHYGQVYQKPYYEPSPVPKPKKHKRVKPPTVKVEPVEVPSKPSKKEKVPAKPKTPKPKAVTYQVPKMKTKRRGPVQLPPEKSIPTPSHPKVGVPVYEYPHERYHATYTHHVYPPYKEAKTHCQPPHKCEPEHPGHKYAEQPARYPGKPPAPKYKKECRKCRKCKRCGPCVEDEHGCAQETQSTDVLEKS